MADSQRKTANLFNKATALANTAISDSSGNTFSYNGVNASDYILVSGMSKISITNTLASRWGAFYDDNKVFVSGFNGYGTINVPQNAAYMRITVTDAYLDSCMVNEGNSLLPYEPYGWVHSLRKLTTATEAVENPLYSDGTAITACTIKGNTVQSGTPTPSNPVSVNGVGVRTINLFSSTWEQGAINGSTGQNEPSGTLVRTNGYIQIEPNTAYSFLRDISDGYINVRLYRSDKTYIGTGSNTTIRLISGTTEANPMGNDTSFCCFEIIDTNAAYIRFNDSSNDLTTKWLMVEGEYTAQTMPTYEPYGYKIPISSGGVTTPIYLGEAETTRKIQKLVFDGSENWAVASSGDTQYYQYTIGVLNTAITGEVLCTHYEPANITSSTTVVGIRVYNSTSINISALNIRPENVTSDMNTVTKFKNWLTEQYNNGTPVIAWYVLTTPTTGVVNEPLMKIGTYADSISNAVSIPTTDGANSITVDTTVQPSEFTATWTGWHNASVKEKSENLLNSSTIQNGYTIASDTGLPISSEQRIATTTAMKIPQGTTAITVTYNSNNVGFMYSAFRNGTLIERVTTKATGSVLSLNNIDEIYFSWYASGSTITTDDVTNIMVNSGSTALPYEPYWK